MTTHLFDGLRVVDAASVIAAPAAAMMLADFGADVVKVEQPGSGDMLRMLSRMPGIPESGDWFWQQDGRNKRSLTLDLKSERGLEVMHRLAERCDVFITNQPYAARESMRLTYEHLCPRNPRMIYASLTAYGEKGAERERKSFDQLAYWARSGLMDLMRQPGTRPTQGLAGMGDHPTGVALYAGIVTALLHRERTGEGGMVHTSLLANGLWSASGVAGGALAGGDMAAFRERSATPSALMRVYQASDGRWLQFNMVRNEELLSLICVRPSARPTCWRTRSTERRWASGSTAPNSATPSPPSWPPAPRTSGWPNSRLSAFRSTASPSSRKSPPTNRCSPTTWRSRPATRTSTCRSSPPIR